MAEREGRFNWHDEYMMIALAASEKSNDPDTRVGFVSLNNKGRIDGIGYNGMPITKDKSNDEVYMWTRYCIPEYVERVAKLKDKLKPGDICPFNKSYRFDENMKREEKCPANDMCLEKITKYDFVVHAENNGITNMSGNDAHTIYSTLAPCHHCAQILNQKGVKNIHFLSDKYGATPSAFKSRYILENNGVKIERYVPSKAFVEFLSTNRLLKLVKELDNKIDQESKLQILKYAPHIEELLKNK